MSVTLEELVLAVSANLHDCVRGTASVSNATTNKMTDTTRVTSGDNRHKHSQVLFLQPATGLTGQNPKTVSSYVSSTGIFTFSDNWAVANGVPVSTPYAIINIAGEGYPYQDIVAAARQALKALKPSVAVLEAAVAITLATGEAAWTTATIPATLDFLDVVHVVRSSVDIGLIRPGNDGWRIIQGTRTLLLDRSLPLVSGDTLTLYGTGPATVPTALTGTVDIDEEEWVNATIEFLTRGDDGRTEQSLAANLYMDRVRTVPQYRRPNSYKVG